MAINPKYFIGDLVKACYTFYDHFYIDEEDDLFYPWNGIVVDVYWDEEYFGDDAIYDVFTGLSFDRAHKTVKSSWAPIRKDQSQS